ncbi:hypothetical protein ACXYN8_01920 [Altererythrobacter sp. CAU 1778]
MAKLPKFVLVAAGLSALAATPLAAQSEARISKGEEELAEMLEGRVAGEPESCIRTFSNRSLQVIDGTALVYRDGKTLWVNRTRSPRTLDDRDYLVIRKFGGSASELCRLDNVTTHDRGSNFFSGVIMLEDFVPYRMADAEG